MNSSIFQVLLSKRANLVADLANLAKRAARKGLPFPILAWGQAYEDAKGTARVTLTVTGEPCTVAGWTFVAVLQHLDGSNVIRSVTGAEVPAMYRSRGPVCDHCGLRRPRIDTYLLVNAAGDYKQVGSTCLADFTGSDKVADLAGYAEISAALHGFGQNACDDFEGGGSSNGGARYLPRFLAQVTATIRLHGWVSRAKAEEQGGMSTSDRAWDMGASSLSESDLAHGAAAAAWAESLSDEVVNNVTGDYLHNLRTVARSGAVDSRTRGIAASIVVAYEREMERLARLAHPSNTHLGVVGEKLTVPATLEFVTAFEHQYGVTVVLKFRAESGEVLVWKASNPKIGRPEIGQKFSLTGTVKSHDTYKGEAQTVLLRCKTVGKS